MKIECKHCSRYLMTASGTTIVQGVICSNSKCGARLNIKVLFNSDITHDQLNHVFTESEQPPKNKETK